MNMSSTVVSSHVQGATLTNSTTSSRKRPREATSIDIIDNIETTKSYMHSTSSANSLPSSSTSTLSPASTSTSYLKPLNQRFTETSSNKYVKPVVKEETEIGVEHMVS